MTITTNTRTAKIALHRWNGLDNQYEPDCFDDLEPNFPREHRDRDEAGEIRCTDEELDDLIEWWEHEVENANHGKYDGDGLGCLTDEEREAGYEWALFVSEEVIA